jgi:ABC-type uncharacterized transport system involved in gliding motility auxiliary subunit
MRRTRAGTLSVAITLGVILMLIGINVAASRATQAVDLTRGGLNTLAPQSVLAAKRLDADLQVIGLFSAGTGTTQMQAEALIGLYEAQSSHIKYRREDVNTDIADVTRYKVKEAGTVVLDYQGKTQLLTPLSLDEVGFTAALINLESDRIPLVCWAVGDGERTLGDTNDSTGYSSVADILAKNAFKTQDVVLSQATSIPSECDELAIVAPTTPLSAKAVKVVGDYLGAGGKLLIAADPWPQQAELIQSLNEPLKPYGLAFTGSLIVEGDPAYAASNDPTIPGVIAYGKSPITDPITGVISFFPRSTEIKVNPDTNTIAVPLAMTTARAWAVAQIRADPQQRQSGDASGPFTIMATVEKPAGAQKTRIVAVGTGAFAENRTLPPNNNDANLELALGSFQWLAGQDALISIPPKPDRNPPLTLTQDDQATIIFITTALMPGLIAFGGIMVWWRRRVFS